MGARTSSGSAAPDSAGEAREFLREVGHRVRVARIERGLTLEEVSRRTRTTRRPSSERTVRRLERGEVGIPISRFGEIVKAIGVDVRTITASL